MSLPLAGNEDLKHPFTPGNFLRIYGEIAGKAHKMLFFFFSLALSLFIKYDCRS